MLPNAPFASELKAGKVPKSPGGGRRWNLTPDGKVLFVGVEGRTLTELWGDLPPSLDPDVDDIPEGEATEALEVLDVFECVCWWPP